MLSSLWQILVIYNFKKKVWFLTPSLSDYGPWSVDTMFLSLRRWLWQKHWVRKHLAGLGRQKTKHGRMGPGQDESFKDTFPLPTFSSLYLPSTFQHVPTIRSILDEVSKKCFNSHTIKYFNHLLIRLHTFQCTEDVGI